MGVVTVVRDKWVGMRVRCALSLNADRCKPTPVESGGACTYAYLFVHTDTHAPIPRPILPLVPLPFIFFDFLLPPCLG